MKSSIFILFMLAIPCFIHSTVVWNGSMLGGSTHAINENIQITGDTWLPDGVTLIQATTQNVKIYLLNGTHHVYSSDGSPSIIQFETVHPFTIEFVIEDGDLIFGGVANYLSRALQIQARSIGAGIPGTVIWSIADNHKLYFGDPADQTRGGVSLEVVSNSSSLIPRYIFKVNENRENKKQIFFNSHSGFFLVEETNTNPTPLLQESLIDTSNTDTTTGQINFKDGSGWFFEFIVD
ncbi:hypothetical protein EKK58_03660 [Candidatus Dependentiae bacterium]|nr:MAG: hypothetical protein EKK58_03660 [Candidatus Dependentiae bacterium]